MAAAPKTSPESVTPPALNGGTALLNVLEWQLGFWRQNADLARDLVRAQQDQALALWRAQLAAFAPVGPKAEAGTFMLPFSPMESAFKAAEQFGKAALEAQRDAFDALHPR